MIDQGAASSLAICDECGRREMQASRAAARAWLASHELRCAPGQNRARDALKAAQRRAGAASTFVECRDKGAP